MKLITLIFLLLASAALAQTDSIPPTIQVKVDDKPNGIVVSELNNQPYITGTGTFSEPEGKLGDEVYLIDYKSEAPTIYALSRITPQEAQPQRKYLFVFKNQKKAQMWSEIAGYGMVALGAYLGGKAEHHRMYHGTSSDWDNFHVTRDAGLVTTGFGCTLIGAGMALDDDLELWEIGIKAFGLLLGYRSIAEGTYNAMGK